MRFTLATIVLFALQFAPQFAASQETGAGGTPTSSDSPSTATGLSGGAITMPNPSGSEESQRKAFGISLFTLGGVNVDQFDRERPSFFVYDGYISFNYRVNSDLRVSARPAFNYSTAGLDYQGKEVTDKMTTRDFSMLVTGYNILQDTLPAAMDLKAQARMYLPTSEGSKVEGMIARLRFEFESKYRLGKYHNLRAYFKPSYFFQRTTAFLDQYGNVRTTKMADAQHGIEGDYNVNKYFSIKPGFEVEDTWSNESDVNNRDPRHETTIAYRMGVECRPMKGLSFTVGYQDRRDLVQVDRERDLSYSLMTNLALY